MTEAEKTFLIQENLLRSITNFQVNTEKSKAKSAMTVDYLRARLTLLEGYWTKFSANHLTLVAMGSSLNQHEYFTGDKNETAESAYCEALSWINSRIADCAPLQNSPIPTEVKVVSTSAHFEKVKLPKFNGNLRQWDSFRDTFSALIVSEPTIPSIIKFQHLLNCLEGQAADHMKGQEIVAGKFESAWQRLCAVYNNRFLRFRAHMRELMNLPVATRESATHLTQLLTTVSDCCATFRTLKLPYEHWDTVIIFLLEEKLSPYTKRDWIKIVDSDPASDDFPTLAEFIKFLERRVRDATIAADSEAKEVKSTRETTPSKGTKERSSSRAGVYTTSVETPASPKSARKRGCGYCDKGHFIAYCPEFIQLSPAQRRTAVREKNLCFNCLDPSHRREQCLNKRRCSVCEQSHHSRLHVEEEDKELSVKEVKVAAVTLTSPSHLSVGGDTLLATALVSLDNEHGTCVTVRALLDPCAQESIISERVANKLKLPRTNVNVSLTGSGGTKNALARHRVSLQLKSPKEPKFSLPVSALVLNKVSCLIPVTEVKRQEWSHIQGLLLADPHYYLPGQIDCLLSAKVYCKVMRPEIRSDLQNPEAPSAFNSVFGWVLVGPGEADRSSSQASIHVTVNPDLSDAVARFWELEEVPQAVIWKPEEQECFQHFQDTHRRDESGRFVVRLPLRQEPLLKGTKGIAQSCLRRLEARLGRKPLLASHYAKFLQEYASLGHLQEAPEASDLGCFLPHHPVWNAEKQKIRVVFNASQLDDSGKSLNSFLHVGPKLQTDIVVVLWRWAFKRYAFTSDIVKMFRQFLVDPRDYRWQQILWRWAPQQPITSLQLRTVTYGTACAPFLANACLLQLAATGEEDHPAASHVLRNHRYVDDFFVGGDSLAEVEETRMELDSLLRSAGMETDKLSTNYATDTTEGDAKQVAVASLPTESVSVLGLLWNPTLDSYCYKLKKWPESGAITKRTILSIIARLFDPCGWIAPVVIQAKLIMQKLWLLGCDWDHEVPPGLRQIWLEFQRNLSFIHEIRVPRWMTTSAGSLWEVHGFSDASEKAYGAVIYIVTDCMGHRESRLFTAKSKVAPVKVISLPRLELCAAHLLTKILRYMLPQLEEQPAALYCWSDSQVTLAWLQNHPSRWTTFVANRVSDIQTSMPQALWNYVSTTENPADLTSRGCSPEALKTNPLWWSGPNWLCQNQSNWADRSRKFETDEELKHPDAAVFLSTIEENPMVAWLEQFSNLSTPVAAIALILRWRHNSRNQKEAKLKGPLSARELRDGRLRVIRIIQSDSFRQDKNSLEKGTLSKHSPLRQFAPFLDDLGIIRVGGRLHNAWITVEEQHPILLPSHHHVSKLLVQEAHRATLHGGTALVQEMLRQKYWILHDRNYIRQIIRECVTCARHNATTVGQQMATLPEARVRPSRPFTVVGVDYAGPFVIKQSPGRGQKTYKGYVALFICLSVKAVHLEVVSDYSSAAFISAFRRFTARRGRCRELLSDNGTTFRGANRELKRLFHSQSSLVTEVRTTLVQEGVDWRFIPPRAPHFGGLWESNIKTFKAHLKKVVGDSPLTYEELSTLCTQIEACMNSRPLSVTSSSSEDLNPLTPGHFLIGGPLLGLPDPPSIHEDRALHSRWELVQLLTANWWTRWRKEYLSGLQHRAKWHSSKPNVAVGDIFIIKEDILPPTRWMLGRVVQLHPGADNLCRVVTLKTASGELVRPIHRLVPLPGTRSPSESL